jgi:hypothetical protein
VGAKSPWRPPQIPKREKFFVWQSMCNENAIVSHPDPFGTIFWKKIENHKKIENAPVEPAFSIFFDFRFFMIFFHINEDLI